MTIAVHFYFSNIDIRVIHKHHLLTSTVALTLSASNLNVIIAACAASWICYKHKYNLYAPRCMRPHCFYINSVCSQLATCKTPMPANARNSDVWHYIFSQNTGAWHTFSLLVRNIWRQMLHARKSLILISLAWQLKTLHAGGMYSFLSVCIYQWFESVKRSPHTKHLCPRMRVTLRCGTTFSHKTRGRESLFHRWLEPFGDHSCTLLFLKHWHSRNTQTSPAHFNCCPYLVCIESECHHRCVCCILDLLQT